MYHLIFIVKIKNNMRVCILSDSLSGLTLAKALTNQSIYVDILASKKKLYLINLVHWESQKKILILLIQM